MNEVPLPAPVGAVMLPSVDEAQASPPSAPPVVDGSAVRFALSTKTYTSPFALVSAARMLVFLANLIEQKL